LPKPPEEKKEEEITIARGEKGGGKSFPPYLAYCLH